VRQGKPVLKELVLGSAARLAIAVAMSTPAQAQYMTGSYPASIVIPPPTQNLVLPKPASKPAQQAKTTGPPPDTSAPDLSRCYQGRVRVC
jgi:hypothetical protein